MRVRPVLCLGTWRRATAAGTALADLAAVGAARLGSHSRMERPNGGCWRLPW